MNRIPATTTFADAIELFDRANVAGLVPDGRSAGVFGMKSKQRRDQIVSHTRSAFRLAARVEDVDTLCITPFLEVLPDKAKEHGNGRDGESGNTAASDVRCFLRTVEGRDYKTKRRVVRETFLPAWLPLANALLGPEDTSTAAAPTEVPDDRWRRYAGWLSALQDVLLLNGHQSPAALSAYDTTLQWCIAAGHTEKSAGDLFCAYRKARELAGMLELSPLDTPPREDARGIRSLPDLAERMAAGVARLTAEGQPVPASWAPDRHPADMAIIDILDLVAPQFAWGARTYVAWGRGEGVKSDTWIVDIVDTASVVVAELARLGEDIATLDWLDLYKERRTVPRMGATVVGGSKRAAARGALDSVVLLRKAVDAAAPASFARSPLTLPPEQADALIPCYTPALFNNVVAVWAVVAYAYGVGIGYASSEEHAAEWRDIEREHDRLVDHMKTYNASRQIGGQKNKDLMRLTWGHAVCVGLLDLWRKARDLRTAWHLAFERNGGGSDPDATAQRPAVETARRAYTRALREYMQAAVILDDGLRIKNYANARMGVNVHVTGTRNATSGLWDVVDGVTMVFRGYDRLAGTKKKRQQSTGAEGKRSRELTKAIVDHALIRDYLNETRIDDLVRAGLITSREAYDPAADRFSLFVSTAPGEKKRAYGGYSEARLSKRFGRFLHHVCRDLLNLTDDVGQPIPTWKALMEASPAGKTLRLKWRALWNAHITRQLVATFVGGLMGNWVEAAARTHDTVAVLQGVYLNNQALVTQMNSRAGMQRADWFLPICTRLIAGEQIDWGTFDPQQPNEARPLQRAGALPPPPRRRRQLARAA